MKELRFGFNIHEILLDFFSKRNVFVWQKTPQAGEYIFYISNRFKLLNLPEVSVLREGGAIVFNGFLHDISGLAGSDFRI